MTLTKTALILAALAVLSSVAAESAPEFEKVPAQAMKELKGDDLSRPLPLLELAIKRPDYQGPAGELIGRVRLRQEVPDKNYVICDILTNWEQAPLEIGDIAFSE